MTRPGLVKRPATYEGVLNAPDHLIAEILDAVPLDLFRLWGRSAPE